METSARALLRLTAIAVAGCGAPDGTAVMAPRAAASVPATVAQPAIEVPSPDAPIAPPPPALLTPTPEPSLSPSPPPPPDPPRAAAHRLVSRARVTRIWARPEVDGDRFIGLLRGGQSVALRSKDPVGGLGCKSRFHAIEPRGFVCDDGLVVVDPDEKQDAIAAAIAEKAGPLPYGYAISNGAPMYNRIPTRLEQARFESGFGPAGVAPKLHRSHAAHEELATTEPVQPEPSFPPFLIDPAPFGAAPLSLVQRTLPLASMVSFTRAFVAHGRTWLLSPDLTFVPADRVRAFRPSTFHGVRLEADATLPIAWIRKAPRAQWIRAAAGAFDEAGASWPARAWVGLTGVREPAEGGKPVYLETRSKDASGRTLWIAESDATVVEARATRPTGVKPGQTWILVSIGKGTLVAYEDLTPVYSTLISPGRGGQPVKGRDNVADATTPLGTYNVTFKDRATTMSPDKAGEDRTFWIADVPHTLYFKPPFALHAAYWHDRFGEPTSAGCVNVAPIDAEWLFQWSEPKLPEGWHGVTGAGAQRENGKVTAVVVTR